MSLNDIFEVMVGGEKFRLNGVQEQQLEQAITKNVEWFKVGTNTFKIAFIQSIEKIGETEPYVGLFTQLESKSSRATGDIFNYPKAVRSPKLIAFYAEIRRLAKESPSLAKEFLDKEYKAMFQVAKTAGEFNFIRFTHNFNEWYERSEN